MKEFMVIEESGPFSFRVYRNHRWVDIGKEVIGYSLLRADYPALKAAHGIACTKENFCSFPEWRDDV